MTRGTIQERTCPRCAIQRTVQLAGGSFCHNGRLHWQDGPGAEYQPRRRAGYAFTEQETARLIIYCAAIRAGFYSDH